MIWDEVREQCVKGKKFGSTMPSHVSKGCSIHSAEWSSVSMESRPNWWVMSQ